MKRGDEKRGDGVLEGDPPRDELEQEEGGEGERGEG